MRIVTFATRKLVNVGKSLYMRLVRIMAFTVQRLNLHQKSYYNLNQNPTPSHTFTDAQETQARNQTGIHIVGSIDFITLVGKSHPTVWCSYGVPHRDGPWSMEAYVRVRILFSK